MKTHFITDLVQVTLFSAPNYCGEFDNAGGMMSVDETLMCSFQVSHSTSALGFRETLSSEAGRLNLEFSFQAPFSRLLKDY